MENVLYEFKKKVLIFQIYFYNRCKFRMHTLLKKLQMLQKEIERNQIDKIAY